jgi:hypothetical protein
VREALQFLGEEFSDDYDRWLRVGMALRQLGDQGLAIWHEWSAGSPKYEPDVLDAKWETFEPAGNEMKPAFLGGRASLVGLGTIFKAAAENGWKPVNETPNPLRSRPNPLRSRPNPRRGRLTSTFTIKIPIQRNSVERGQHDGG